MLTQKDIKTIISASCESVVSALTPSEILGIEQAVATFVTKLTGALTNFVSGSSLSNES